MFSIFLVCVLTVFFQSFWGRTKKSLQNLFSEFSICFNIKTEKFLKTHYGERASNLLRFWNECKVSKFGWREDYSGVNHEGPFTKIFSKRREIAETKATEYVLDRLPVSPTLCFD